MDELRVSETKIEGLPTAHDKQHVHASSDPLTDDGV